MEGKTSQFNERVGSISADTIDFMDNVRPILDTFTASKGGIPQIVLRTPDMTFYFADVRACHALCWRSELSMRAAKANQWRPAREVGNRS